ncbi:Phytosulfokine precursor protein (PSK) [Musa troglodytarum]|uniref:Phytosulfokine n=1 Tax=Musa troglodytarum TaxID=320322 RepID=A0A9E7G511_9LILI|nr:Phytosulfokine precursor protein (PSK) [Musa troglodytarum]
MLSKHAVSLFLALLLLASLTQAARPQPADSRNDQGEVADEAGFDRTTDEECGGISEDECLMRRTLVARTDYIYTQGKKP